MLTIVIILGEASKRIFHFGTLLLPQCSTLANTQCLISNYLSKMSSKSYADAVSGSSSGEENVAKLSNTCWQKDQVEDEEDALMRAIENSKVNKKCFVNFCFVNFGWSIYSQCKLSITFFFCL